jgi:catechol-2,3-dioxygenase
MRRLVLGVTVALALLVAASSLRVDGAGAPVAAAGAHVTTVGMIGMTVANVGRSAAFYADVLGFEKVSDVEVTGERWARLYGVPDARLRIADAAR